VASIEIHSIQTVSGNQPRMRRLAEAAGNSYLAGTPLALNASGFVIPWAGTIVTNQVGAIIGTSKEFGANLASAGVAQQQTFGSVPNESAAVNISRPYFNDGLTGVETADPDTIFLAQVGPAQTAVQALIGTQLGMTKDADNHWYVDTGKTTVGTNTCVIVVKLDPNDQSATPRGVYVRFVVGSVQPVA
jgi:hypothetical protein